MFQVYMRASIQYSSAGESLDAHGELIGSGKTPEAAAVDAFEAMDTIFSLKQAGMEYTWDASDDPDDRAHVTMESSPITLDLELCTDYGDSDLTSEQVQEFTSTLKGLFRFK